MNDRRVLATGLRFPEGPVALANGDVACVEIEAGRIVRITPSGEIAVVAETKGGPNGLALGPEGAFYVCNNGGFIFEADGALLRVVPGTPHSYTTGAIQRVNPQTGHVDVLYTGCGEHRLCGPNDLVFDAEGGFFFTDFGKTRRRDRDIGSVYYAKTDGSLIVEVIHPVANPNGIGLSPDGQTLYVAETETSRLWSYPVIAPGVLGKAPYPSPNGGTLVCGLPGYQRFDSLALEANGNICVATLVVGEITVIAPNGAVVERVRCPDHHTTNICFGGPDLRQAFVTQSTTGKLIAMDWPRPGLRLNWQVLPVAEPSREHRPASQSV